LIAGGQGKGADFSELAAGLDARVRQVILLGEAADEIEAALKGRIPVSRAADMTEAPVLICLRVISSVASGLCRRYGRCLNEPRPAIARHAGTSWHILSTARFCVDDRSRSTVFTGTGHGGIGFYAGCRTPGCQYPAFHCAPDDVPVHRAGAGFAGIAVLVPGVGVEVNGSTRWINLGLFRLQVSEPAKLLALVYMAGYLVRHGEAVRETSAGFIKPLALLLVAAVLLLMEPDFGATVVMMSSVLVMMFMAGVSLWKFTGLIGVAVAAFAALAVSSPYRLERLTTFLNPWADPFDTGFQLTQSLMAIGLYLRYWQKNWVWPAFWYCSGCIFSSYCVLTVSHRSLIRLATLSRPTWLTVSVPGWVCRP